MSPWLARASLVGVGMLTATLVPASRSAETALYAPQRLPETMPTPVAAVASPIPHPRPSAPLRASRSARRPVAPPVPASKRGARVATTALSLVGSPYRWGGTGPAFDCSGLAIVAWASAGVIIPRTSQAQWRVLSHVPLDQLTPGDLVFFGRASHVGIYVGGGRMIHAPHRGLTVRYGNLAGVIGAARPG